MRIMPWRDRMPHRSAAASVALLPLAAGLFLTGCPPTQDSVTITFDQVGACNGYKQTTGPPNSDPTQTVFAGLGAAFVAFRIVSIDNSKSSKDFNFDPARLFVTASSPREFMNSNLSLARDLGVFTAVPTIVPKGKNMGNNGVTVTTVSTSANGNAAEANNTSYFLSYDTPAGDPITFLAKRNPTQTSWPQTDNCRAIHF